MDVGVPTPDAKPLNPPNTTYTTQTSTAYSTASLTNVVTQAVTVPTPAPHECATPGKFFSPSGGWS